MWASQQFCFNADSLLSGGELHQQGYELRRAVCYMMDKHREDIEPFIGGDFEAYLHHMASEGVWGGMTASPTCSIDNRAVYTQSSPSL